MKRDNRLAVTIIMVPFQLHSTPVLGTVDWTASNIDEIKVLSPE
jgi:hypothetical protein